MRGRLPLRVCGVVEMVCCWGVVVLGEECEPSFEGCLGSRIGQGEEVGLSGGCDDVVLEE